MAVKLSPVFNDAQLDSSGNPYVGAQLFTYAVGSTTKQTAYQDSAGLTQHTNPIVLNSRGEPPAPIWLTEGSAYKLYLTTPTDTDPPVTSVRVIDGVRGVNDATVTIDEWISSGLTPTYISATSFTLSGDQTTEFHEGRRLKVTDSGGSKYVTITGSTYTPSTTTVVVAGDALASPTSAVSYSIVRADNPSISSEMIYRKGTAIASAATCDIWNTAGDFIHITGSTGPITSFGTAPYAGAERTLIFDSTPSITHNATTLQVRGGASVTMAAGDRAVVRADTTANMIITDIVRATGVPVVGTQTANTFFAGPGSGAAAVPAFRAPVGADGASLVLIGTTTAVNAATVDFTSGISSTYDDYILVCTKVIPQTDNTDLWIRASTDGGSTFLSTNEYDHARNSVSTGATNNPGGGAAAAALILQTGLGNSTGEHLNAVLHFHNLSDTAVYKGVHGTGIFRNQTPAFFSFAAGGMINVTTAINALRLMMSSGNINGTFSLYGVRKA